MATKTNNYITRIWKEVELLRSLVIGTLGKDKEGEYRPEFVEEILRAVQEKSPHTFKDSKSFLKHLRTNL